MTETGTPFTEGGETKRSRTWLIILVIVLGLCCVCSVAAVAGWYLWTYGDQIFGLSRAALPLLSL